MLPCDCATAGKPCFEDYKRGRSMQTTLQPERTKARPPGRAVMRQDAKTPKRCLTFELTGPRRQDALARAERMYRVPQLGPRWPAVAGPVERGVRQLS